MGWGDSIGDSLNDSLNDEKYKQQFNSFNSFKTRSQFTESSIPSSHSFIHSFIHFSVKKDISLYTGLSAVSSVHRRFCRIAVLISPLSHSIRCPFPSIDKIGTSDPSWITVEPSSNPIPSYASRFSLNPTLLDCSALSTAHTRPLA